jgi:hypothetical protein
LASTSEMSLSHNRGMSVFVPNMMVCLGVSKESIPSLPSQFLWGKKEAWAPARGQ